ncbi:MAG: glycosyltransferase [Haemophilus parainfluenzae]|nr:glycosyltransferase [Haemophilus parainfluenzae]
MEKLTCYMIYASEKIERLSHFLQCASDSHVVPISAVTKEQVSLLGHSSALFNLKKAEELLDRTPKNKEIAHTLSHIQCWKAIAENEQLQDDDFALIAESEIQPVENFILHAINYANKYSSYGIIKLQHDGEGRSGERLFQIGDEPDALVYGDTNQYNYGCSLYLIRKDVAKKLTALSSETKPYWLADQFTAFHEPQNIAQARYLLGENPSQKQQDKVENPLFSIIVPIYNVERYLEQCIESVLAQDYQNYELILVDDGSPDNSIDICTKYAKQYSNIVFIHKINGGLSDARNAGIKLARGEYLMFLDSDDYWEGTSILSDLQNIINENNPDAIFNYMSSVYPDKIVNHYINRDKLIGSFKEDFQSLYQDGIYLGFAVTKTMKRELILKNHLLFIKGRHFEDIPWSFSLVKHIKNYAIYKNCFYMYRRERKGAISSVITAQNQISLFQNLSNVITEIKDMKLSNELLPGLKKYADDIYGYVMTCYNLLSNEEKTMFYEDIEKINKEWIKINIL